jgi:acyl-CoA thioesterase FadM
LSEPTNALVATGEQQVAFMNRSGGKLVPAPIPESVKDVLDEPTVAHAADSEVVRRSSQ